MNYCKTFDINAFLMNKHWLACVSKIMQSYKSGLDPLSIIYGSWFLTPTLVKIYLHSDCES